MSALTGISAAFRPITFLLAARALRDFGDGFVAVLLPVYLLALGFSPLQIGVIATGALLGSALITLGIGLAGARYDHRRLLLGAVGLMLATGLAFAAVHDFAVLLLIACIGTVNPPSGSVSIFVPVEHAVLTREVTAAARTRTFARYSLVGVLAGATGALAAAVPNFLAPYGMTWLDGIRAMFVLYALLGLVGELLYARIPALESAVEPASRPAALGPWRRIVYRAVRFSLDTFAGGFAVQSLLALWLFERFEVRWLRRACSSSGPACCQLSRSRWPPG